MASMHMIRAVPIFAILDLLMLCSVQAQSNQSAAVPAAAPIPDSLTEITVTAQRRSERLVDVPISISTVDTEQLRAAGATDIIGLTALVPGLKMNTTGTTTIPAIRGITTQVTEPGIDANVATYVDGLYQPAMAANDIDLPDVEHIEVLKGPQGTLYGRNATGGVIQIFTKDPVYETTGSASLGLARFNDFTAKGFISAPLVDGIAAGSISVFHEKSDSYYNDVIDPSRKLNGLDTNLVRAKLRVDPADGLKISLIAWYADRKAWQIYGETLNGNSVMRLLDPNAVIPSSPYGVAFNEVEDPMQEVRSLEASLKVDYDTRNGTFTSLTGHTDNTSHVRIDPTYSYSPAGINFYYDSTEEAKYVSQDFGYASHLQGPLNFTAGLSLYDGWGGWRPAGVRVPGVLIDIWSKQEVRSYAGFSEGYYDITSRLSIIAGVRYTWEEHKLASELTPPGSPASPVVLKPVGAVSWHNVTPRVSLRYKINPDSNVYFAFNKGFKSGGFESTALGPLPNGRLPIVNPETVKAYEVGYKGRVGDRLTLEAAVFHYDYSDVQTDAYTYVNGVPLVSLTNAASAKITGGEVDAQFRFDASYDVRLGVSLLHAKYGSFPNAQVALPLLNASGMPLNIGNKSEVYDATGKTMVQAPQATASLAANAHYNIANGLLHLSTIVYYSDKIFYSYDDRITQPAYATLDARAAWTPKAFPLTAALFGRNLTNKTLIRGAYITNSGDGISYQPPRIYGVQFDYKF